MKSSLRKLRDIPLHSGGYLQLAHQAVPMLCILKKNGKLRTVFNLQEQNDNTIKDMTLFPDQDIIHNDMARAAYQSKLDMSKV